MRRSHSFDNYADAILRLRNASEEEQRKIILAMSPLHQLMFDADFEVWAHQGQLPPETEGWRLWLMMAGRGFGKTRAGAEWIFRLACGKPGVRIALAGASIADARSIMVEGVSGLLAIARLHRRRVNWEPSLGRLKWPNGSEAQLFSGDHADGLRGPEHDFAWADELAKWRQVEEAWVNLQFGLRRGARPRALVTTTPRPIAILRQMMDAPWTVTTRGRTTDNINLDEKVIELLTATYGGTRIGAQELEGELLEDVEGALWTREMITAARILSILPGTGRWLSEGLTEGGLRGAPNPLPHASHGPPPRAGEELDRIVVGVDPPAGASEGSDACGIVVAGSRGEELFVLEDASVQGLSPEGWANRVAAAAARWNTAIVVAEANNGGAMVGSVLKAADFGLKCGWCTRRRARAPGPSRSRSGSRRAEPFSRAASPSSRPSWPECRPAGAMKDRAARPTGPTQWCGR